MGKKLIDFIDITKSYNGNVVLDDLNLYIRENDNAAALFDEIITN